MSTFQELKTAFPDNAICKYPVCTPECKLTAKERWLWYCLLKRFGGESACPAEISRWTGISRHTLPQLLRRLVDFGFVQRGTVDGDRRYRYAGRNLPKDKTHWFKLWQPKNSSLKFYKLQYNPVVHSAGRNFIDGLVEASDYRFGRLRPALLASRFGLHSNTIRAARKRLSRNPLIENPQPDMIQPVTSKPVPTTPEPKADDMTITINNNYNITDPDMAWAIKVGNSMNIPADDYGSIAQLKKVLGKYLAPIEMEFVIRAVKEKCPQGVGDKIDYALMMNRDNWEVCQRSRQQIFKDLAL